MIWRCLCNVHNRWCTELVTQCRNSMTTTTTVSRAVGRHKGSATDGAKETFHQWKTNPACQMQPANLTGEEYEGRNRSNNKGPAGNEVRCSGKHLQHHNGGRTPLCSKVAICWQIFITARSSAVIGAEHCVLQHNSNPCDSAKACDAFCTSHQTSASSVVTETVI